MPKVDVLNLKEVSILERHRCNEPLRLRDFCVGLRCGGSPAGEEIGKRHSDAVSRQTLSKTDTPERLSPGDCCESTERFYGTRLGEEWTPRPVRRGLLRQTLAPPFRG